MKVYAIGDLHLNGSRNKPMSIFGEKWHCHQQKIEQNWSGKVGCDDIVAIPGDISWAMTLTEAADDLKWIHSLPGRKILVRGNHDYWWKKITHLNSLYESMTFLQNNAVAVGDIWFAGSRGWLCPGSYAFQEGDEKIYARELLRLEMSLKSCNATGQQIIALIHYPPVNEKHEPSGFTELFEKYQVKRVLYGHLHDKKAFENALIGEWRGVDYQLVSADFINFSPLLIEEL